MRTIQILCLMCFLALFSCNSTEETKANTKTVTGIKKPKQHITVLGIAQDAGYPHINCENDCCKSFYDGEEPKKLVSCLGLVDLEDEKKYIFDATPDFTQQTQILKTNHLDNGNIIDGVFLTHAHIGHYTGLMYFGREALGKQGTKVYAMPKMKHYLETNGPWSQLVANRNIALTQTEHEQSISLTPNISVTPILVPHRDEYSETVGYSIKGPQKTALFIPDIDKWHLWERDILEEIRKVDYAFLDGSFYQNGEIKGRDMSQIPHPFLEESMDLFKDLPKEEKSKIYFIHFNHTNPVLQKESQARKEVEQRGFQVASEGQIFEL